MGSIFGYVGRWGIKMVLDVEIILLFYVGGVDNVGCILSAIKINLKNILLGRRFFII